LRFWWAATGQYLGANTGTTMLPGSGQVCQISPSAGGTNVVTSVAISAAPNRRRFHVRLQSSRRCIPPRQGRRQARNNTFSKYDHPRFFCPKSAACSRLSDAGDGACIRKGGQVPSFLPILATPKVEP